jgi:hypothetical protein
VTPPSVARRERSPSPRTERLVTRVEDRLARLETAEEVRGVLAAYARACDERDLDALTAILHPDVVLTVGTQWWRGRDEVLGFFRGHWESSETPQRHFVTNVAFHELAPDRAEATAYLLHVTVDGDGPRLSCGSYRDTFIRLDGSVLLKELDIALELWIDLREDAAALAGRAR